MTREGEPITQIQEITGQYRQVVGALEEMFAQARQRTNTDSWRRDGVGSCRKLDKRLSELWLDGHAKNNIIVLRDDRNKEIEGNSTHSNCPYHRNNLGCVLTDVNLKSPLCISFFENSAEWRNRFGINTTQLTKKIINTLAIIQTGGFLENTTPINIFTANIHALTERIQKEPRLEGGSPREKMVLLWKNIKETPRKLLNAWIWKRM